MGKHKNKFTTEHIAKIREASVRREQHRALDRRLDAQKQKGPGEGDQKNAAADPLDTAFTSTPTSTAVTGALVQTPSALQPPSNRPPSAPPAGAMALAPDPKRIIAEAFKHFSAGCSIEEALANLHISQADFEAALKAENRTPDTVRKQAIDAGKARLKLAAQAKGEKGDARLIEALQRDRDAANPLPPPSLSNLPLAHLKLIHDELLFTRSIPRGLAGRARTYGWENNPKWRSTVKPDGLVTIDNVWPSYDPKQPRYRNPFRQCPICGHEPTMYFVDENGQRISIPPFEKPAHPFCLPEDPSVTTCPPDTHGATVKLVRLDEPMAMPTRVAPDALPPASRQSIDSLD